MGLVTIPYYMTTNSSLTFDMKFRTCLVLTSGVSRLVLVFCAQVISGTSHCILIALPPSVSKVDDFYDHGDNIYEDVASVAKFHFNQNSRKRKGAPKSKILCDAVSLFGQTSRVNTVVIYVEQFCV